MALGAAAFLALHVFVVLGWERLFQPAALETPWLLGSKTAIVFGQLTLGALGLARALRAPDWRTRFVESLLLTLGAMLALSAAFFLIGPEKVMLGPTRLWPVALVSALFLLGPAVVAGALLGGYLRSRWDGSRVGPK